MLKIRPIGGTARESGRTDARADSAACPGHKRRLPAGGHRRDHVAGQGRQRQGDDGHFGRQVSWNWLMMSTSDQSKVKTAR